MTPTEQDKELRELYKQVRNNSRVILYTDVMGRPDEDGYREQVSRDDMWAISTAELDKFVELITADRKRVALEAHNKAVNRCREEICYHFDPNGEREPDIEAEAIDALLEHLLKAQQEEVK